MNEVVAIIDAALAAKGLEAATASKLAGGNASLIKNIRNGQGNVGALTLQTLAKVLDLEFYFGPKRVIEPATVLMVDRDFVLVPLHDAHLAAGAGAQNGDNAPITELAFHRKWLRALGLSPGKASVARASGDSMLPTISAGDMLLIDLSRTDIPVRKTVPNDARRPPIYALRDGDGARVKRIARPDPETIILLSDNQSFLPEVLTGERAEALAPTIIGQVRWSGRTIRD